MTKVNLKEVYSMHAMLCQAIAAPIRIALLYELSDGVRHVNELVDALQLPQATVSRHLKILRESSLVKTHRDGPFIYYELTDPRVIEALDIMRHIKIDIISHEHNLMQKSPTFS